MTTDTPAPDGGLIERLERAVAEQIEDYIRHIQLTDELMSKAAAALRARDDRIKELEREREKWKRQAGSEFAKSCELADRALTAEARVERLRDEHRNAAVRVPSDHDFQANAPGIIGSDICTVCGVDRDDHGTFHEMQNVADVPQHVAESERVGNKAETVSGPIEAGMRAIEGYPIGCCYIGSEDALEIAERVLNAGRQANG